MLWHVIDFYFLCLILCKTKFAYECHSDVVIDRPIDIMNWRNEKDFSLRYNNVYDGC